LLLYWLSDGEGYGVESYLTVAAGAEAEFTERRSRFLGSICPVSRESDAAGFLAGLRSAHWKASHCCYAYLLREGGVQRYSDDGEPQGTAGVPILEVLKREGITDVIVAVTRYFGGILLGAGGLARAYSHSAKLALDAARIIRMCRCVEFALELPYPQYEPVQKLLETYPAQVLDTAFTDNVTLFVRVREEAYAGFAAKLTEFSAGKLEPVVTGEVFTSL
jgi:uncharacterized YigZ family protein